MTLLAFDLDLTLENEGDRHDLVTGLFDFFLASLPGNLDPRTMAASNVGELKRAGHKLHGAVRYCGIPRPKKSIEKLELDLMHSRDSEVQPLISLLTYEVNALNTLHQDNPNVLSLEDQQITHR